MVEGIDLALEDLKAQLAEIRQKISQLRKMGLDTRIVEIKVMAIPSKINMAEITKDYRDVQKIISLLNDGRAEIRALEKEYLINKDKY